jgi:methionine-rich copper-binding protein CopC
MNRFPAYLALAATAALSSAPAQAHAFLSSASPAVGSTTQASPSQIVLTFTESLEPAFSHVEVRGPGGVTLGAGARISGKQMVIPVHGRLQPGAYHVTWRATASDTHKTQGDFTFTVAR